MKKLKSSTILRKAAEALAKAGVNDNTEIDNLYIARVDDKGNPRYCCGAIYKAAGSEFNSVAKQRFQSLFRPRADKAYWFGEKFNQKEQERRIFALLFTADMCESVGD